MFRSSGFSLKPKYIAPKAKVTPFAKLKLGREINSGIQATVFNLKGFNSLVVKTNSFNPESLKWSVDPFTKNLLSSPDKDTVIMEKVSGEPLFGKEWLMTETPFVTYYKYQLRKILAAPKEAFLGYIKSVVELRKNGYDVDYVNPNNILYDKKNKKFNIVDIGKDEPKDSKTLDILYFGVFWDEVRLLNIYDKANFISRIQISNLVKKLMDKICDVAQKNGYKVDIEPLGQYPYQRPSIYFYNNQRKVIDAWLKNPEYRDVYLIRSDD